MNAFSSQAPKNLAVVLLATVAVVASAGLTGCGAVKSGFNTDPLAGNDRYKAMQKEGVPQPGDQVGLPNPVPVRDHLGRPVPGELPPAQEPGVPGQLPASIPGGDVTQMPTAGVAINKITLVNLPVPETQVLNFVEGQAAVYRITVVESKGAAKIAGLPKGATFTKISEDVYDLKWIPAKGLTGSTQFSLKTVKISVGEKRLHNVIVSVVSEEGTPLVEKISLNSSSINAGDAVGFQVVFKDGGPQDQKPSIVLIEDSGQENEDVRKMYEAAKVTNVVATENGRMRADVVLETKGVKLGEKVTELRFAVAAERGEAQSVAIPQVIKLNQKLNQVAKAATSTKKATGAKK
jgi:hypothetical protein